MKVMLLDSCDGVSQPSLTLEITRLCIELTVSLTSLGVVAFQNTFTPSVFAKCIAQ